MNRIENVSRRQFLHGVATTGAFVLAARVMPTSLLAQQAGGQNRFELEAATVRDALGQLPVADLLFDEGGTLRPLVNVYLDGRDVRDREGLETGVADGGEVRVVAAIAGG